MKIAFSSNAFKKCDLTTAVGVIADCGYQGVEIMADVPHAYPPKMLTKDRRLLRNLLRQRNLEISNINAFTFFAEGDTYHPSWIETDELLRRRRIEHTETCLHLAADLGAPCISVEPGGPLDARDYESCWKLFKRGLEEVLPLAEKLRVKILVEPEPKLLLENSKQMTRLLSEMPHPWLGFNCDLGHFFCVGEDPAEIIRRFGKQIAHVHLEDIAASREHRHLALGTGAIDFNSVFKALKDIAYAGFVTVELYPYENEASEVARAAFEFLREHSYWK